MAAESVAHGRKQLVLKIGITARTETCVERRGQHWRWHAFINGRFDGPSAFARIRNASGKPGECRIFGQRVRRQVEQPRGDYAAAPPDFRNFGEVKIKLIVFRIAQRRGLGIAFTLLPADVGAAQDAQEGRPAVVPILPADDGAEARWLREGDPGGLAISGRTHA